jgi:hypothetical protein
VVDYNFDGYKDFSVSHIDDGMGTYTIYDVFLYSPKGNGFVAVLPRCGDMFNNILVNKKFAQ